MSKKITAIILSSAVILTMLAWGIGAGANGKSYDKNTMNMGAGYYSNFGASMDESDEVREESYNIAEKPMEHVVTKDVRAAIETLEYDKTLEMLRCKVKDLNGYISQSDETMGNAYNYEHKYATITAEVPTDKVDDFLAYITKEFTVTEKHVSINDITSDYVETESRLEQLKVQKETLLGLLKKAGSLSDTIAIQDKLTEVSSEIQYNENMMARMKNDVDYTTVSMTICEVDRETPTETGFWYEMKEGFKETVFEIGDGFRAMIIWLVSAIPFIALLLVFGIIIKKAVKAIKTKKDKGEESGGQTDSNSVS